MENTFGDYVKHRRTELELDLNAFASAVGVRPEAYSRIERGLKRAPTGERLKPYLRALRIEVGSQQHQYLETLADVANGVIPKKFLRDKDLAAKLPILFNGMINGGFTERQIEEIFNGVKPSAA